MNRKWTTIGLVILIGVVVAGCPKNGGRGITKHGGKHGGTGGAEAAVEISEAARETFNEAVGLVKQHDQAKDWEDKACKKVADLFRDASEEQPDGLAVAIFNAGLVYRKCGDDGEAKKLFKEALRIDPNYSSPRIALSNYAYDAGDISKAEKMYSDAIKGAPLALETVEAYVNLAQIQRTKKTGSTEKNREEAQKNLRRALAIDAESMPAFTEMAYLYLDQALKDKSKLTLAEVVCVQATKIDGAYAPIYNVWGLLKMREGEIIDALKYFEKAYTLDSKMFEAYMNFGSITIGFRGYKDAKNVFEKAVKLRPGSYEARINLAIAKRGLEDFKGAEKEYLKALDLDKTRPEAYFDMGVLYQDYYLDKAGASGYDNFKKAIEWYNKFKSRAGGKKNIGEFVKEAGTRIKDSKKAIELMKEAAHLMKEAGAMQKEAEAEAKKEEKK